MEIRLSRYNQPFVESSTSDIHYISLDDQRDMRLGNFDSHVRHYFSLPKSTVLEIFDPFTRVTFTHDVSDSGFYRPFNAQPAVVTSHIDFEFLGELRSAGVKVAGVLLSSCACKRPWRCSCNIN
jgi:hypothetical protein